MPPVDCILAIRMISAVQTCSQQGCLKLIPTGCMRLDRLKLDFAGSDMDAFVNNTL